MATTPVRRGGYAQEFPSGAGPPSGRPATEASADGRTQQQAAQGSDLKVPAITLPKGGGAIRGVGEKFAANPVNGSGGMSVPLALSPGRACFGPQLELSYDSGSGNGLFGFGWSLALPAITRKTDKGLPLLSSTARSPTCSSCRVPRTSVPVLDVWPVSLLTTDDSHLGTRIRPLPPAGPRGCSPGSSVGPSVGLSGRRPSGGRCPATTSSTLLRPGPSPRASSIRPMLAPYLQLAHLRKQRGRHG